MVPLFPRAALPAGGGSGTITPTGGKNEKTKGEFIKMNSTKKNSEFGGVKKKLTAAIAMLLVATIMMVSSTYAWFTLSTAPEVTGITTSVGANGNLEMALLNGNANDDDTENADNSGNTYKDMTRITSNVGDSSAAAGQTVAKANMTWGNLVDLGATEGNKNVYGLDKITLNPARLHIAEGKVSVADSILNTATYGNDGRVVDVSGKTYSTANYGAADGSFKFVAANASYGVRAIGGNDNLSKQQAGLLAAKAAYVQYMNAARGKVVTSVQTNGQDLTNAILTLATDGDGNKSITDAKQQNAIKALIQAFSDGADQIDLAYIEAIKAAATSLNEAQYETVLSAIKGKTTASEAVAAIQALANAAGETKVDMPIPQDISNAITALAALRNSIKAASDSVSTGTADYKAALNALVNTSSDSSILINGYKLKEPAAGPVAGEKYVMVKKTEGTGYTYSSDFISSAVKGVEVKMGDNTGVFAEFASLANNYSIPTIVTVNVSLGGMTIDLKDVSFTLTTTATVTNYTNVTKAVTDATAAGNATAASTFLSDTYGYAIDLAFRTNAAGSSLLLATDGVQRIYNGTDDKGTGASTNTDTLGGGSTMTFKTVPGAVMTTDQIKALMGAIRVVFMDPEKGTIYGIASVDNIAADTEDTTALTGKLTLKKVTFNTDGSIQKLEAGEDGSDVKSGKLLELPQNTPTKLSVVVYLDGDKVDNSMVANTDVMQSITGSLNLQFKSSADLNPMDYSPLKNGTATTKP